MSQRRQRSCDAAEVRLLLLDVAVAPSKGSRRQARLMPCAMRVEDMTERKMEVKFTVWIRDKVMRVVCGLLSATRPQPMPVTLL